MLDGPSARNNDAKIGNLENNNPAGGGGDEGPLTVKAKLRKGGRKLRAPATVPPHLKAPRGGPAARLADHNNNTLSSGTNAAVSPEQSAGTPGTTGVHHPKPGAKKELLKPKGSRSERGATLPAAQPSRHPAARHDQSAASARGHRSKPSLAPGGRKKDELKKPLKASDNVKALVMLPAGAAHDDGEKVYAGAKFSEPPSPSVLPKPPSHWVGQEEPRRRQMMSVHLKTLLKVRDAKGTPEQRHAKGSTQNANATTRKLTPQCDALTSDFEAAPAGLF